MMTYSDFPIPDSYPTYPHHRQIIAYFNSYVDKFNVRSRIRFHTEVLDVAQHNDGKSWNVTTAVADGRPQYVNTRSFLLSVNDHVTVWYA
jgi:cation diffusion facilitator CzcD-associated flavoprotein CzcO